MQRSMAERKSMDDNQYYYQVSIFVMNKKEYYQVSLFDMNIRNIGFFSSYYLSASSVNQNNSKFLPTICSTKS